MARNQGAFTVVVKRSRRVIEKGARPAPAAATFETPALPGWVEAAGGGRAVLREANDVENEAAGSQARRAAEELFAPRRTDGPRILLATSAAALPIERGEPGPASEPVAVFRAADVCSATTEVEASASAAQPMACEATAETDAPAAARAKRRYAGRSSFPPGQRWREALPESCWPEGMRRAVRRTRRRAARRAAGKDEPVQ